MQFLWICPSTAKGRIGKKITIHIRALAPQLYQSPKMPFLIIKLAENFPFYCKIILTLWPKSVYNIRIFSVGIWNKNHDEDKILLEITERWTNTITLMPVSTYHLCCTLSINLHLISDLLLQRTHIYFVYIYFFLKKGKRQWIRNRLIKSSQSKIHKAREIQ